ncbi:hypothetical protein JQ634_02260 [Bradyrhizobium sp. AUGA SZCCT0240]|uniref:hypothetical protein n=1 Tax=unclassified Bradyrhizobium TaxID=2631580 RepID=UPI001BA672F6|nr:MULTISPECIES: hypothetical protein [unclassified Bradyrhizobium]MBR1196899.1 hypothetical protein [Bradyrhizobium sp. AUGA SZCCT0158]MBR1241877.1 hypothetical protein [Bradyrhizobium sp. AUGA SZCCT0274]MBR1252521.1 hypothetical protein [Bradyrhizobium sp. AUGA SZCCT0240]
MRLLKLEESKFNAYIRTFRFIRTKMLDGAEPAEKASFETEDLEATKNTAAIHEMSLFTEVGKALSAWASLEEIMVCIASKLMCNSIQKAGVVMYSIINFGTWLSIISELLTHEELYTHLKPRFDKLTNRLRALKEIRDRLAHHSAFKSDIPAAAFKVPSLAPSPYDVRAKSLKYQPLTLLEIQDFGRSVVDMAKDLAALVHEMEAIHSAHIDYLDAQIDKFAGPGAFSKAIAAKKEGT